jgi:predicted TIM-barrel fold metal-dependent hydrolase
LARKYEGPIVDVDIHHSWKAGRDVVAYLPKHWQEYVAARQDITRIGLSARVRDKLPGSPKSTAVYSAIPTEKGDTFPDDGSPPGTDYATLREQLLDRYNIWRGVLTFNIGSHVNGGNAQLNVALARAVHDWNADTWLTWDDRLYGVVAPSLSVPEEAAKEIRRVGQHPRIASTLFAGNPFNRPYGDPVYHPIYEASAELGLPVQVHPGAGVNDRPAGGGPSYGAVASVFVAHDMMHHISSYIVHGVFEKYPTLRVLIKESGIGWLPYLMWRLDRNYELLKLESPWVKRLPSEYIREHVMLDTQPLDKAWDPEKLEQLISTVDGVEDMLCFASDYPHAATDDPNYVSRRLPASWTRKVMCDNACRHYGWTPPPADAVFEQPALASTAA